MKKLSLILIISSLLSCKDKAPANPTLSKAYCVKTQNEAIKLAEKEWLKEYGQEIYSNLPFKARLDRDTIWVVDGSLAKGVDGGTPYAEINAKNCEIITVTHTK